jgi:magnesium-transporting ATPase (P-type)
MQATQNKSEAESAASKPAKAPEIASAPVPDTLAALHVNPDVGLTHADVDVRRKEHGYNEVAEKKGHPALKFIRKFWGISAWMLELIMVLSAVLGKYSDLIVVGALLVINAVLSFMQEHRAAGVVEALRKRLQINARVRRDSNWQVIPARELVPGDIVRVRPGDIIPADVKLLTGALTVDQSALTGESKDADKAVGEVLSSGSIVRRGEGNGVVLLTGAKTYFGRTTELVQEARPKLHIEAVVALASQESNQDPIDLAFLAAAKERHIFDNLPKPAPVSFVPFDAKNRRTEAVVEQNGQRLRVMKGAVRTVAEACGLQPPAIEALEARVSESALKGI